MLPMCQTRAGPVARLAHVAIPQASKPAIRNCTTGENCLRFSANNGHNPRGLAEVGRASHSGYGTDDDGHPGRIYARCPIWGYAKSEGGAPLPWPTWHSNEF